ncbi:MAG: N-acetylglucosamine-6-phosphate deacetylase [Flavitalea sp.]
MGSIIFAGRVFTGTEVLYDQTIHCENGRIITIQTGKRDTGQRYAQNISAGFNDTHINGGKKFYLTKTADAEGIHDIASSCEEFGTAYCIPTLITSPIENILKGISATRNYMAENPASGVLGLHLEGPFLNPIKRGAHLPEYIQKPTDALLKQIIKEGKGVIKLMTIAPELFSADQVKMLLESGITISAGHSNATYDQSQAAFDLGIKVVTHLYNAMSGLNHRNPGLVGACFVNDNIYAPIILDGFHCDYSAAKIAYKIKKDKLFLISDALFLGERVKEFQWGNFNASLKDGRYINSENNLAGATISLADGVRNAVKELGIELQEAIEMATIRPSIAMEVEKEIGVIAEGYPAVFTVFDDGLNSFEVVRL